MATAILVFVKEPTPGQVKTRLAASVGFDAAARIYQTIAEYVLRSLPPGPALWIFYDPPAAGDAVLSWLNPILDGRPAIFTPQRGSDLGEKLSNAFSAAFEAGIHQAAVIGTDCVEIPDSDFLEAFEAFDDHDVILGPAADGGYYLLALDRPRPELFENIAWSSSAVLSQTLERAKEAGLRIKMLPIRSDVDTVADWERAKPYLS